MKWKNLISCKKQASGRKDFQVKAEIRGHFIYWLDENLDTQLASFFGLMNELTLNLKRFCFLSLSGSEFHIANIPPDLITIDIWTSFMREQTVKSRYLFT